MAKELLKEQIAVAAGELPADLIIKNGKIVDVFNGEIIEGNVAISSGMIVGVGDYFKADKLVDAKGKYICPGLIDGHVHIESSLVTPAEYSKVVVPKGVTTVITDPHELANVLGRAGIDYVLDATEGLPLDVHLMLPSSVPASINDSPGAVITAEDLEPYLDHPRVRGLAEVMDYPSVASGDDEMLEKILMTLEKSIHIDGHAAGLTANQLNIYRTAQIRTDHENTTAAIALEQVKRGFYVIIREGSAAKDLLSILPAVTERNSRRFLFCTDDKEIDEIIAEGSIDFNVRLAIENGLDPITAIQIATINAAECYQFNNLGAVAPGYQADLVLLSDLEEFKISEVYKGGQLVADKGNYLQTKQVKTNNFNHLTKTVNFKEVVKEDLKLSFPVNGLANVIKIIPRSIMTEQVIEEVTLTDGEFIPDLEKDQLKIVAVERHHRTGEVGLGIVKGFELKAGAMATTHAHDSHNIIAVGTQDEDLVIAINRLKEIDGGFVLVKDGEILAELSCEIAGLISTQRAEDVKDSLEKLNLALQELKVNKEISPFQLMSFLSLPVIPKLKLTCRGLFNVPENKYISVNIN